MNIYAGSLKIETIETVARETKKFIFTVKDLAALDGTPSPKPTLDFKAGQFVSIQFRDNLARAYSIASSPSKDTIELIIRIVPNGAGSMIIDAANIGDEFIFKGPFGHFVLSDNPKAKLLFFATGTGIAPIRSMILTEKEKQTSREMSVFYGGKDLEDLAYLDEIEDWNNDLKIHLGLSREEDPAMLGKYGKHCRITKFLEDRSYSKNEEFYICGNGGMVKSTVELLKQKGVDGTKIFNERFN